MTGIRAGYYIHYKDTPHQRKIYYVYGLGCVVKRAKFHPKSEGRSYDVAHFSEDPSLHFVVVEAAGLLSGDDTFGIYDPYIQLPPNTQFVIYRALWCDPEDKTPRLAIRPLTGSEGFTTDVLLTSAETPTERFRYHGPVSPLS